MTERGLLTWTYATATRKNDLHPTEVACLSKQATAKRIADFERGREAGHQLVTQKLGRVVDAIVPEATGEFRGRPRLLDKNGEFVSGGISITHASGFAAAAISAVEVGIDLVEVEDHGSAFREEAFHPSELSAFRSALASASAHEICCLAFAAKEAALKVFGVGLRLGLRELWVRPTSPLKMDAMPIDEIKEWTLRWPFEVATPQRTCRMVGAAFKLNTAVGVLLALPDHEPKPH